MRRSRRSSARERLRSTAPLAVVAAFTLLISMWLGTAPGPLGDIELPGAPARTIGTPIEPVPREQPAVAGGARAPDPDEPGSLEVRVVDAEGRARSGVPVAYDGPRSGRAVTSTDGTVVLAGLPAGTYRAEVGAGCIRDLEIFQGRRGTAEVYPDTRSVLRLGGIEARARYWPAHPVHWSSAPPWNVGSLVTVTVSIFDRCRHEDAAAGRSLERLTYAPSELVTIAGRAPATVEETGGITLRFRCAAAGTPRLLLRDPETGERQDLLRLTPAAWFEPACG